MRFGRGFERKTLGLGVCARSRGRLRGGNRPHEVLALRAETRRPGHESQLEFARRAIVDRVKFLLWCVLFVLCWPLALVVLVLWPLVWLLSLPFRLLGLTLDAVFATLEALLFLPARLLGRRTR